MKVTALKFLTLILSLAICAPAVLAEGEMTKEEQAMMANFEAYSTPNENHEMLAALTGSWKATVEHRMTPEIPPQTSEGTGENVMIYGGRFLEQTFHGDFGGMPFEGKNLIGYDNIAREFRSIWYDNMGTGIVYGEGKYDPAAKTITEEGRMSCPLTNDARWYRSVVTFVDADHYTYESFMKDDGGNEYRSMLIEYVRTDNAPSHRADAK